MNFKMIETRPNIRSEFSLRLLIRFTDLAAKTTTMSDSIHVLNGLIPIKFPAY